jgi:hypothetical protein
MKAAYTITHITHNAYTHFEQLTAFGSCFTLMSIQVNWADKLAGFIFSISASLLSAFLVTLLKDWRAKHKKEKDKTTKD